MNNITDPVPGLDDLDSPLCRCGGNNMLWQEPGYWQCQDCNRITYGKNKLEEPDENPVA